MKYGSVFGNLKYPSSKAHLIVVTALVFAQMFKRSLSAFETPRVRAEGGDNDGEGDDGRRMS